MVSLVLYLGTLYIGYRRLSLISRESARIAAAVIAFLLMVGAVIGATRTHYLITSAVVGYLAVGLLSYVSVNPPLTRRLGDYFGDEAVRLIGSSQLPRELHDRMLRRLAATAVRQRGVPLSRIATRMYIKPLDPGYWSYDYEETYIYEPHGRVTTELRVDIHPEVLDDQLGRSATQDSQHYRSEPSSDHWKIVFWPRVRGLDWSKVGGHVEVTATQFKSRDTNVSRDIPFVRREIQQEVSSQALAAHYDFISQIELDQEWDGLRVHVKNIPHTVDLPRLQFYAQYVCSGNWSFSVALSPDLVSAGLRVGLAPVTSLLIVSHREATGDSSRLELQAKDLVLLPEDAVLVSLWYASSGARARRQTRTAG